jgi:hypothetical protein
MIYFESEKDFIERIYSLSRLAQNILTDQIIAYIIKVYKRKDIDDYTISFNNDSKECTVIIKYDNGEFGKYIITYYIILKSILKLQI